MVSRFRRTRRGIEVKFDPAETSVLRGLLGELIALLTEDHAAGQPVGERDPLAVLVGMSDSDRPAQQPTDPALARLLPDGYRDDPVAAEEFRRFTQADLRSGKRAAAVAVRDRLGAGGRLALDDPAAVRWLGSLNDLRLAMGARLDVTEETYDQIETLAPGDPRRAALSTFAWLGWLEETLVAALSVDEAHGLRGDRGG